MKGTSPGLGTCVVDPKPLAMAGTTPCQVTQIGWEEVLNEIVTGDFTHPRLQSRRSFRWVAARKKIFKIKSSSMKFNIFKLESYF